MFDLKHVKRLAGLNHVRAGTSATAMLAACLLTASSLGAEVSLSSDPTGSVRPKSIILTTNDAVVLRVSANWIAVVQFANFVPATNLTQRLAGYRFRIKGPNSTNVVAGEGVVL